MGVLDLMSRKTTLKCRPDILYDFDYTSLFIVMKHQLRNIYKSIYVDNNHHVVIRSHKRALIVCINLCDRLARSDYIGKYDYDKFPTSMEIVCCASESECQHEDKARYKLVNHYSESMERLKKYQLDRIWNREKYDQDMLFKLLNKYIRCWWD
jgi:hypothetical protein